MKEQSSDLLTLVCIDGADDFFKLAIKPGKPVSIGHADNDPDKAIQELSASQGTIVFTNQDGRILMDAANCSADIKLNGQPASTAVIGPNDILRIGRSIWKVNYPEAEKVEQGAAKPAGFDIRKNFSSWIGLEELNDFKLKHVFSNVFKKHSVTDIEEQLVTGTIKHTPALTDIETGWARPWLFSRLLLFSVILTVTLVAGFKTFENPNLIPGLIFIGAFAMPLATLIFFLEMNAPRNISIFMVVVLLFLGGVTSLLVALIFFRNLDFLSSWLGASSAGIIEEIAKVLIVVALFGKVIRYRWGLNGLLLGAAIGCGFGAFESAGYAFRIILQDGMDSGVDNILLRGMLAPFMHIVWTANAAAALWLVKEDKKFAWSMLAAPKFLRVMISSMILHMTWNTKFVLVPLPIIGDLKYALLGILAWIICFRLVQAGLNQLNAARRMEVERLAAI